MSGAGDVLGYCGKRVLVTGCASGIGHATAATLIDLGAEVHGLDRNACDLPLASFHATELGDPAAIDAALAQLAGPFDALFNCVGLGPTHAPADVVKVNFLGIRYLTERLLDRMGEGSAIVSVSSTGGSQWRTRLSNQRAFVGTGSFEQGAQWYAEHQATISNAYAFSKEALIVWTLQQSTALIARRIRINCTSPGAVRTAMLDEIEAAISSAAIDVVAQPIGRRSSPQEQAWPLLMLGSSLASYINGIDLAVDGGFAGMTMIGGKA